MNTQVEDFFCDPGMTTVTSSDGTTVNVFRGHVCKVDDSGDWVMSVATIQSHGHAFRPEEAESFLHIVAAATDMKAALEHAVEQYGNPGGPWNVPNDPGGWLDSANKALAKARGENV